MQSSVCVSRSSSRGNPTCLASAFAPGTTRATCDAVQCDIADVVEVTADGPLVGSRRPSRRRRLHLSVVSRVGDGGSATGRCRSRMAKAARPASGRGVVRNSATLPGCLSQDNIAAEALSEGPPVRQQYKTSTTTIRSDVRPRQKPSGGKQVEASLRDRVKGISRRSTKKK